MMASKLLSRRCRAVVPTSNCKKGGSMRNKVAVLGVAAAVVAVGAGYSFATIPDSAGVIHACYSVDAHGQITGNGDLRLVDPGAVSNDKRACKKNEASLTWNQTGPQGPAGPQGA